MHSFYKFFKNSIQLFYSYFNVLIFIIVLKPFRKWLSTTFVKILTVIWGTKKLSHGNKSASRIQLIKIWNALIFAIFSMTVVSACIICTISSSIVVNNPKLALKKLRDEIPKRQASAISGYLNNELWFDYSGDPRVVCDPNQAMISIQFKRCFFVKFHSEKPLNQSEHVEYCASRGAVLTYPRDFDEWFFVWSFYQMFMADQSEMSGDSNDVINSWFLHLGYQRTSNFMIKSVDGKMIVPLSKFVGVIFFPI